MPRSKAKTVAEYLAALPDNRRAAISAVRQHVLQHLPKGYEETMSAGMIAYVIPLARFPKTYNKLPLWYVALASEKSYCSLHLMRVYDKMQRHSMDHLVTFGLTPAQFDVLAQIEALLRGGRDVQREALRVRSIAATNGRQRRAAGVKIRKHIGRMRKECRELSRIVDQLDDIATQLRGVL